MTKDDIIRMAREAGLGNVLGAIEGGALHRFFHMAIAAEREKVAKWQIGSGYSTGHGETIEDLLVELEWQVRESERELCAKVCDEIRHPWGFSAETPEWCRGTEHCATAIRARGQS